jgi:hypothetical protein
MGNTRKCSPGCSLVLNAVHSSGRWLLGCHWPKLSRWLKMRSLARAFSSSRRAPPISASNLNSSIASSSVTLWCTLRDSPSWARRTVPRTMLSSTLRTISLACSSAARESLKSVTSWKLWPVSIISSGYGMRPTPNAFSAHLSMTSESLPPENSSVGRSNAAATSRRMKMVSSSSASRCWLLKVCSNWGSVLAFMVFEFLRFKYGEFLNAEGAKVSQRTQKTEKRK